jgi:hypothetical protein
MRNALFHLNESRRDNRRSRIANIARELFLPVSHPRRYIRKSIRWADPLRSARCLLERGVTHCVQNIDDRLAFKDLVMENGLSVISRAIGGDRRLP